MGEGGEGSTYRDATVYVAAPRSTAKTTGGSLTGTAGLHERKGVDVIGTECKIKEMIVVKSK